MLLSRTLSALFIVGAVALFSCDRNTRGSDDGEYKTWSEILADSPSEIAKQLRRNPFERCETEGPILRPSVGKRFSHQRNLGLCEYRDSLSYEHPRPYQIRYVTYAEDRPVRVRLIPRTPMPFDAASLQQLDIDFVGTAYSARRLAGENEIEPRQALFFIDEERWDDYEPEEIIAVTLVATADASELAFAEIYLADNYQLMREEVWDPITPFLPDDLTLPSTRSSLHADLIGPPRSPGISRPSRAFANRRSLRHQPR